MHPIGAAKLAEGPEGISTDAEQIILQHHESLDGIEKKLKKLSCSFKV